jgi:hypothetical protein
MQHHALSRDFDYADIVATSERVAWTVDRVLGDRRFDASRPIVPPSWVGSWTLAFLDDEAQLVLNHCRAFSYVHLLGNFEEFASPHLGRIVEDAWHGDRARLRALMRFADEEMKHQQLLRRAEWLLEASCGHAFARWFDDDKVRVTALSDAILAHPPLPRFLMVLALEWGTQRHYLQSVRDGAADPLYAAMLKAHWIEEAQHTKSDALEIAHLARGQHPDVLREAFDHVLALGALVDAAFAGQAAAEVATLQAVTGRRLDAAQAGVLQDTLHRSLRGIFVDVGMGHPEFARVARGLSRDGAARIGIH